MFQIPFDVAQIFDHPIFGILFFFIGLFILYKFIKLTLKYTVRAKSDYS